jgi:8-oxo-dGTP pyrophosphatase MutT (NUDIX family)
MKYKKKDLELKGEKNHAQVVIINDNGEVCLVSRKKDHTDFGLVGGKLDEGETFEEAAIREAKEETGLDVKNLVMIFAMHRKSCMGQTFLAEYSGEINYDQEKEPHIVKWGTMQEAVDGTFGYWNTLVRESLESLEIDFKK